MNAHLLWTLLALGPLLGRITADLNSNRTPTRTRSQQRPVGATNGTKLLPDQHQQATVNQQTELQQPAFAEIALGFCEKYQLLCTAEYHPLCAVDAKTNAHRTFHNGCEMRRDACLTRVDWKTIGQGPCSQHPKNTVPKSRAIRNIFAPKTPVRDAVTDIMTPPIFHAQYLGVGVSPKAKLEPYFDNIFTPGAVQTEGNEDKFQHWNGAALQNNAAPNIADGAVIPGSSAEVDVGTNKRLNTGEYQGTFVIPSIDSNVPYESLRRLEKFDESRRKQNMDGTLAPSDSNEPQAKPHSRNPPGKYSFLDFYRRQLQSDQGVRPHDEDALKSWQDMHKSYDKTFALDSMERDMAAAPRSFGLSQPPVVPTYYGDIYGLSKVLSKTHGAPSMNNAGILPYRKLTQLPDVLSGSSALSTNTEEVTTQLHSKREDKVSSSVYLKDDEENRNSFDKLGAIGNSNESLPDKEDNRRNGQYLEVLQKSLGYNPMPRSNLEDQLNQELSTESEGEDLHPTSEATGDRKECKLDARPVCGSFSGEFKTFKNLCDLEQYIGKSKQAWTVLHEGACETCPDNCSGIFEPVCVDRSGVNFTLANACYLELAKCRHKTYEWKMLHHGECQSSKSHFQHIRPSKFKVTSSNSSVAGVESARTESITNRAQKLLKDSAPKATEKRIFTS